METPTTNTGTEAVTMPPLGNPLETPTSAESSTTIQPQEVIQVLSPVTTPTQSTETSQTNQTSPVQLSDVSKQESFTPPTPISSGEGAMVNPPILPQGTHSSKLGIVIGIVFLIALIVGASLYYYFFMYKQTTTMTTPTTEVKTLIKKEEPAPGAKIETPVVPPVDEAVSLETEISNADQDLGNTDTTLNTFNEQVK